MRAVAGVRPAAAGLAGRRWRRGHESLGSGRCRTTGMERSETYATAFETGKPYRSTSFGSGGGQEWMRGLRTKHAVVWPDPRRRPWDAQDSLCGKSAKALTLDPGDPTAVWPRQEDEGVACPRCEAEVASRRL